jgi:hypothetical protein
MTDETTEPATSFALDVRDLAWPRRVFLGVGIAVVLVGMVGMVLFCVNADGWDAYLPAVQGGPLQVVPHSDAAYPYAAFGMLSMFLGGGVIGTTLTRERTLLVGAGTFGVISAVVALFILLLALAGAGA